MKTKYRNSVNNCKNPNDLRPLFDLFGEISVTWDEIILWCEHVPKIKNDSWRLEWYVKSWNVPDKIRAAKLAGRFEALISGFG